MRVRQAFEADHVRVLSLILRDPIGWIDAQRYTRDVASGSYRANRLWIAEDDTGRIVGCAVWWGFCESEHPLNLDCLYVDRAEADRIALGAKLLRAGQTAFLSKGVQDLPRFDIFLKPEWRGDSEVRTEIEWRRAAAQAADLTVEGERLRYEWTPDAGLEQSSLRLLFSPDADDNVFLDAFRRVAVGSLDQETRRDLMSVGLERHARKTLACYRGMPGNRAWWRVAHLPDGTLVGFTIPSANEDNPVIGYLGVVPELRGHGYAGELLAEATRILAANGAERIRADTDATNLPMAATFERARYRLFGVRLMFSPP